MRRPDEILDHPQLRAMIDFNEPVGLLFVAVLHFLRDDEDPAGVVARFRDVLAPCSYLVVSHAEARHDVSAAAKEVYERATAQLVPRTREHVVAFFDGFGLAGTRRRCPRRVAPGRSRGNPGPVGHRRGRPQDQLTGPDTGRRCP